MEPSPVRRLAYLDALRGVAAYYVVIYHVALFPQPNLKTPEWATSWVHFGGSGVTLFFIVSAFSLCLTMPRHLNSGVPLTSFFVHRFFRIAPLFYLWLFLSFVRDYYTTGLFQPWTEVVAGIFFVFNLLPQYAGIYVWAGWTVGVEMLFYAIFPLLYFRCYTLSKQVAAAAFFSFIYSCFVVLAPYWIDEAFIKSYVEWLTVLRHLPIFAVGLIAFRLVQSLDVSSHRNLGLILLAICLVAIPALIGGRNPGILSWYEWQGITFGCLLLGSALAPLRLIVNTTTIFFGKISYSLYLNHSTVIFFLQPVYSHIYATRWGTSLKFLLAVVLTTAIVVPLSYLSYLVIEVPGMRIGQRLVNWFQRRAGRTTRTSGDPLQPGAVRSVRSPD
ncbi:MAG: acyltransferase [Rhodospirillales bacterium]